MDWTVLGIEPTKDKKEITAAYRKQLRERNPEDNPEAFKVLRAAYENALAFADREDLPHEESFSPVEKWIAEVRTLYSCLADRIDPDKWRAVLQADICFGLDTRPLAEEAMLKFLMEHYFLPKSVWLLLEENFHFAARTEELREQYPAEFLDNVIRKGIKMDPVLPFALFKPGESGDACDQYIRLYFEANRQPVGERAEILEKLAALPEYHPYGDIMRITDKMAQEESECSFGELCDLARKYPKEQYIQLCWAEVCLEREDADAAEAAALEILEENPEHHRARLLYANCLAHKGNYIEAKEYLFENMRSCESDPILINYYTEQIRQWNVRMIPLCEARMAEASEDMGNLIELSWCYIQNEQKEKAVEIAGKIVREQADPYKYNNLMGKLYHNMQEFGEALPYLQATEALIRQMKHDGTEETRKRIARLPELLQIQGNCLMQLGKNREAREKFEEALRLAPEDVDILLLMAKILYTTGEHEYAVEILERVDTLVAGRWHSDFLRAMSLFRLQRDREAFEAVNRAIASGVHDLSIYLLKLQILIRNHVWEEVHTLLDYLRESGAPEDISLDFVKAQLTELEEQNATAAFAQYQKIARRVEAGEPFMWGSDLYYRMAYVMHDSMDMGKEDDRELLIAMLDKGLALYDQDPECLAFKAWLYQRGGQIQETIAIYRGILEKNKRSSTARDGLSRVYSNHLDACAREALEWYEELISEAGTAELYWYAATCKWHLGDLEGARRYFCLEMEADPDDVDAYNGLAYLCDTQGKYEESLAYIEQGIQAAARNDESDTSVYRHKVMVLRRMGKIEEALTAAEVMKEIDPADAYQLKFDILCQFGLWDRAANLLKEWKKELPRNPRYVKAKCRLHLLLGKPFKASVALTLMGKVLEPGEIEDIQMDTQELIGGYDLIARVHRRRAKEDPRDYTACLALASALKYGGKPKGSKKWAEKGLMLLDKILEGNLTDEALYRCQRSRALALLGRLEEATAELEKARKLPICDNCPYGSCKDADIYEAVIREQDDDLGKALELFRAGRKKWPDDLDFQAGESRIRRKGI